MPEQRYRCLLCRDHEFPLGTDFAAHEPRCPRCQATAEAIVRLCDVHLMVRDQRNGPIVGLYGYRYHVACKPDALNPRGAPMSEQAAAVSCPACKATREYAALKDVQQATAGGIPLE